MILVAGEPEKSDVRTMAMERMMKIAISSDSVDVAKEAVNVLTSYREEGVSSLFTVAEEAESDLIKWLAIRRIHEIVESRSMEKK